jgi:hypothetical protein
MAIYTESKVMNTFTDLMINVAGTLFIGVTLAYAVVGMI